MTPNVAMVEDDVEIRKTLSFFLDACEEIGKVDEFGSVEAIMDAVEKGFVPDVVLMDINLPGKSGIEGIYLLKERFEQTDIIMLTIYNDEHKIFDSLCAGATGYLLKNTPLNEVKQGIINLHNGGSPMSPQIARKVIKHFKKPSPSNKLKEQLSERESEIVDALVDGLSYKLIADRLFISVDTVRFHIKNIYKKLQVNSKAEVISKALKGDI